MTGYIKLRQVISG